VIGIDLLKLVDSHTKVCFLRKRTWWRQPVSLSRGTQHPESVE